MLFQSQREELTGNQYSMYFAGTTLLKGAIVAFVTGVRNEAKTEILATIQYLHEDGTNRVAFSKMLTPANFEKLLNEFAMKVATVSSGNAKLIEVRHNFTTLNDEQFPMSDAQKDIALRAYLLKLINGGTQQDAIRSAGSHIKKYLLQV
jgi:hypothetical protein